MKINLKLILNRIILSPKFIEWINYIVFDRFSEYKASCAAALSSRLCIIKLLLVGLNNCCSRSGLYNVSSRTSCKSTRFSHITFYLRSVCLHWLFCSRWLRSITWLNSVLLLSCALLNGRTTLNQLKCRGVATKTKSFVG